MIDPRAKIIFGIILISLTATITAFENSIISLALSFLLALGVRIKWKDYFKRLLIINSFVFFLSPFILFTKIGVTLFSLGLLTATDTGLTQVILIFCKLNAIILYLFSTFLTLNLIEIGKALQALHFNQKLITIFFFASRYLSLLKNELTRIFSATKARGFKPKSNIHSYKTIAYLFGSLLLNSLDRAERVQEAMACRGFNGTFHSVSNLALKKMDYFYIALMSLLTLFIIWIEYVY